tara:strand:- start:1709 stop:2248 length:540 start_codon:yes stop_codon:yes gene_type:complete
MIKFAIAFGFRGKLFKDILKAWRILEKEFNIKHMAYNHALPHITVLAGQTRYIDKIYKKLKKIKFKKFKLQSPGLGIFANEKPNLYIRWENNLELLKNSEKIRKTTISHFKKIFHNQVSNNSFWVPKTTVAWQDLRYKDMSQIFRKIRFMYKKKFVTINQIYIIELNTTEKIIYKINLN